jgi:hypothetical protein
MNREELVRFLIQKTREAYELGVREAAAKANFYAYHWYVDGSDELGKVIVKELITNNAAFE